MNPAITLVLPIALICVAGILIALLARIEDAHPEDWHE